MRGVPEYMAVSRQNPALELSVSRVSDNTNQHSNPGNLRIALKGWEASQQFEIVSILILPKWVQYQPTERNKRHGFNLRTETRYTVGEPFKEASVNQDISRMMLQSEPATSSFGPTDCAGKRSSSLVVRWIRNRRLPGKHLHGAHLAL